MTDQRKPFPAVEQPSDQPVADDEVVQLPPPANPPGAQAVNDHVAGRPLGLGHQPSDDLEDEVDDEHLHSPGQGVRPEARP
ncbi:MAG TPA: hypothetical protein VFP19_04400 [Candidatus Limnocylindrales bacterium]|nr:hypothetical protein [Candidatus Limnocylindrales bacterium]